MLIIVIYCWLYLAIPIGSLMTKWLIKIWKGRGVKFYMVGFQCIGLKKSNLREFKITKWGVLRGQKGRKSSIKYEVIKNVIVTSYFIIFLSLIFVWYKFHLIPMKLLRLWEGFSDGLGVKEFAGKMFQGSRGTYSSGGLFMQLPPPPF